MSAQERLEPAEPEYLHLDAVAERMGVQPTTIRECLRQGRMPEPDLVWLEHPLWLPSTIDGWKRNRRKWRPDRALEGHHRVRTEERPLSRPPKLVKPAAAAAKPIGKGRRKLVATVGSRMPVAAAVVTLSRPTAQAIALELRAEGHFCTTGDVLELADHDGELDHARGVLRARIVAKVRELRADERARGLR